MSDVTFGVKVSQEVKEKVNQIIEASGMKSKEWFETVLMLYEMEQLKQGSKDFSKDLSELEIHTNRIVQLVGNMVTRATHEKERILQQIEGVKASKDEIILGYQQELSEIKEQIKGYVQQADQAEKNLFEATKHALQLEETNENNKALIGEYKDKIDTLTGLVNEYKGYSSENKELKQRSNELEQQNAELLTKINRLNNDVSVIRELNKTNLAQAEERHNVELERLTERLGIEKERELLQIRTEFQDRMQKANEDYTAKLQALYEEMNELRKSYASKKTDK